MIALARLLLAVLLTPVLCVAVFVMVCAAMFSYWLGVVMLGRQEARRQVIDGLRRVGGAAEEASSR